MIKIRTEMLHFATVGQIFEGLPGAQIMHTISLFESWEVRSPELQTVLDLELKRRSYGRLKMIAQSTNENFAATKWATKIPLLRKIHPPLRKCSKLQNGLLKCFYFFQWAAKMFFFFPFRCKMISKQRNGL